MVTIGSSEAGLLRNPTNGASTDEDTSGIQNSLDYQVICEPGVEAEWHTMKPLEPVRVRTDYQVFVS